MGLGEKEGVRSGTLVFAAPLGGIALRLFKKLQPEEAHVLFQGQNTTLLSSLTFQSCVGENKQTGFN